MGQPYIALVSVTSMGTARSSVHLQRLYIVVYSRQAAHSTGRATGYGRRTGSVGSLLLLLTVTLTQQRHPLSPRIRHSLAMGALHSVGNFSHNYDNNAYYFQNISVFKKNTSSGFRMIKLIENGHVWLSDCIQQWFGYVRKIPRVVRSCLQETVTAGSFFCSVHV